MTNDVFDSHHSFAHLSKLYAHRSHTLHVLCIYVIIDTYSNIYIDIRPCVVYVETAYYIFIRIYVRAHSVPNV